VPTQASWRDGDVEVGGASPDPGVRPPQPLLEQRAKLGHGHAAHEELPYLRDHDEPLAGHLELVHQLHVPGEHQHHHVPRPHPIRFGHRPRQERLELGGPAPEHIQAIQPGRRALAAGRYLGPGGRGKVDHPLRHRGRDAQDVQRAQDVAAQLGSAEGASLAQVRVQQRRLKPCRRQPLADLVRGEPGLLEAGPHQVRAGLQQPERVFLGHAGGNLGGSRGRKQR